MCLLSMGMQNALEPISPNPLRCVTSSLSKKVSQSREGEIRNFRAKKNPLSFVERVFYFSVNFALTLLAGSPGNFLILWTVL